MGEHADDGDIHILMVPEGPDRGGLEDIHGSAVAVGATRADTGEDIEMGAVGHGALGAMTDRVVVRCQDTYEVGEATGGGGGRGRGRCARGGGGTGR